MTNPDEQFTHPVLLQTKQPKVQLMQAVAVPASE